MENDWKKRLGVVYSTNSEFEFDSNQKQVEETPLPGEQKLYGIRSPASGRHETCPGGLRTAGSITVI